MLSLDHLENSIIHSIVNSVIHGAIYKLFKDLPLTSVLIVATLVIAVIYLFVMKRGYR